ncbi:hypothetical protein Bca4012_103033 [Brassica carinata]
MRELQRGSVKIPNRTGVDGNVRESETPGGIPKELSFLFNSLPTPETAQPEVGSSGWKSTARRVVSVHSRALENRRTECRTRHVELINTSVHQGEQPLVEGKNSNPPTVGGLLEPLNVASDRLVSAGDGLGTALSSFPAPNSQLRTVKKFNQARFPLSLSTIQLNHSQGNGLGRISGKEDPVELDSSPTL